MYIQPNEEGWSFSGVLEEGQFCLVYKDKDIIYYGQMEISTTETLFIGTQEDCDVEIEKLELYQTEEISLSA